MVVTIGSISPSPRALLLIVVVMIVVDWFCWFALL
jgi:hypothetical protein